ncbi:DUF885 domain-containing protein [Sphingomonas lenta]|uniref:DUF885 domain-containing protein n=1 Tax=Sphingomonas lenta TaxID=1141887 RepID=A0A2A2SGT3_9SPHN|nr:DUF885 family protein [Sphingomonas lenta]PAX08422.1 DUF885 domain-containing protein [Sphingomonas lenta]
MHLTRRTLLASSGATFALVALPARAEQAGDAKAALDAVAEDYLRAFPTDASELGIDTGARAALRSRLTDKSPAGQQAITAMLRRNVARLNGLAAADAETRLHADVVRTAYESALRGYAFGYGDVHVGGWRNSPYVVIQNVGAYIDIARLLEATHKLETPADADAYLSRLGAYAGQLDGETARLRDATAKGVIPPAFLLDKAIAQLRLARGGDPASWSLVTTLAARYPDRRARAAEVARARILPALDRQIAALVEQRARAGDVAGVHRLPDGPAYYRWALQAATTTTRDPDEIHAQGLDELKNLQSQMDALLRPLGYTDGGVGRRMRALGQDKRFLFPGDDAGRAQIIAYCESKIAAIRPKLPELFGRPVKGIVEVRRIPPAEEPGAAGAYGGAGSLDGSIPGRFWINLRDPGSIPRFTLPTLTMHEAIPGHVWQGEYAHRLPLIRTLLGFSAYQEGWALYAEQLADEVGLYADDPAGRLGYLQAQAFRAARLVVDTGLHYKRWTREQAKSWFAEATGQEPGEIESEVDRYCAWPGQACAYKIGHSEIARLRDATRARLGTRYDRRAFNDAVVQAGPVPMTVLAGVVGELG